MFSYKGLDLEGVFVSFYVCILNLLHDSDFLGLVDLEWFFPLMCSIGFSFQNKNTCYDCDVLLLTIAT
jgi:hypothetical protein